MSAQAWPKVCAHCNRAYSDAEWLRLPFVDRHKAENEHEIMVELRSCGTCRWPIAIVQNVMEDA